MKYVIIQGDGMGDLRDGTPGATTPLEAAHTPAFDRVAGSGLFGLIHTIPQGLPPGSDVGNLSLFGYDPHAFYTGRSPLEAAAMGVKLGPDDVAFRMNLVTLDGGGDSGGDSGGASADETMADYSAGHIDNDQARRIVTDLGEQLSSEAIQFFPGVSYRHLMVWRQGREQMKTTPPHDILGKPIAGHLPTGEGAETLCDLMTESRAILAAHPVNRERADAGQSQVSQVWFWGQGRAPSLPTFAEMHGLKGACISAVDLVRGVATYAGFTILNVPGATGYIDTDYAAKGEYGLKALQDHDLVFIHVEAPDESGHMGSREEKIRAIESIDRLIVGPMLEKLPEIGPFKFLITSDHATPVSLRTHTPDPVPFAMATREQLARSAEPIKYGEAMALAGGVAIREGNAVIDRLVAYEA